MPDLAGALAQLAETIRGVRAVLVIEIEGIEVATWGEADFETASAELAELWRQARAADGATVLGGVAALELLGADGTWVVVPLGSEYALGILSGPGVPPGRVRFHAREWAREREGDFR